MNYFKDKNTGEVYAYDQEQIDGGWVKEGLVPMTDEEVSAHLAPPTQEPQVPPRVTMRQARLALHAAGLLQSVEDAIDAMPEPPQTAARIEWDYASEVHRASEFVGMLGGALGLDDQGLDELFFAASIL